MYEYSGLICAEPVSVRAWSSTVGKKEGSGPLGECFDRIEPDSHLGCRTWEQAESELQRRTLTLLLQKAGLPEEEPALVIAGDLVNQCTVSTFAVCPLHIPYLGIFSACAAFAEGLLLGTVLTGGAVPNCAVLTSSHFSTAERQFRFPAAYGGQRTPNAQWTCTAAGAALLTKAAEPPFILGVCPGRIADAGLTDAANMGAAMAPAAADTVLRYLSATGTRPEDYDAIVTGDLGTVGSRLFLALLKQSGADLSAVHKDCGVMMFDGSTQDTHAGGSGCGCSASVICGYFLPRLRDGRLKNILYAATGALLSPLRSQQGESVPGICHLIHFSHFPRKGPCA